MTVDIEDIKKKKKQNVKPQIVYPKTFSLQQHKITLLLKTLSLKPPKLDIDLAQLYIILHLFIS